MAGGIPNPQPGQPCSVSCTQILAEGTHWSFSYLKPVRISQQNIFVPDSKDLWLVELGWFR